MSKKKQDWAHLDEVPEAELSEMQRVIAAVERNPKMFGIGALVVAACIMGTLVFQMQAEAGMEEAGTAYARALELEDDGERLAALGSIADDGGVWHVEALYMVGETAIRTHEYERASAAFEQFRSEHTGHPLAPQAVEALAFIAENSGDLEGALALYEEIEQRWPDSFSGQLQQLSIGRVKEAQGDLAGAKEAYDKQVERMGDSSRIGYRAQIALSSLKQAHPELFPKPEVPVEEEVADDAGADEALEVVVEDGAISGS